MNRMLAIGSALFLLVSLRPILSDSQIYLERDIQFRYILHDVLQTCSSGLYLVGRGFYYQFIVYLQDGFCAEGFEFAVLVSCDHGHFDDVGG